MPAVDTPPFSRIAIVGLGLVGGSVALAARRRWLGLSGAEGPGITLIGVDRAEVLERIASLRLVDGASESLDACRGCDLVVLAVPLDQMAQTIDQVAPLVGGALVTDVAGAKRGVMAAAAAAGLTLIGGHPMAGSERSGAEHARADLFDGRPWVLVAPTEADGALRQQLPSETDGALRLQPRGSGLEDFVRGLGALPIWMTADAHDRAMAYVSHLPQLMSSALMATVAGAVGPDGYRVAGQGLLDMTRLAASSPDVWRGVLSANADYVDEALAALQREWAADISDLFERAAAARGALTAAQRR